MSMFAVVHYVFATFQRWTGYAGLITILLVLLPKSVESEINTRSGTRSDWAENGMVVSAHEEASRAGVEIMKQGGNAVDAAVATGFALAVVYPVAGNLGGGGFMVIRQADGEATTIDFREKAPLAATRTMYLGRDGVFIQELSDKGHLASGVPGSVAGLLKAHSSYGRLPLEKVIEPAIHLAEQGFELSLDQANRFNRNKANFSKYEGTRKYFTKRSGQFLPGERFVQKDLADVLKRIRDAGRDGFYRGKTADLIVEEMKRGGGLITHEDLERYQAVERAPVTGTYRGYRVISMGPPSSGGVALLQLLNAVEPYPADDLGFNSSALVHLAGEAMRLVYADRAKWLGDPDFYQVPVAGLIDKSYMHRRMSAFDPEQAGVSETVEHGNPLERESSETTHYSVVDREGNAVSVTTTINGPYGSHVVVDGAGFFLNNEMDDFSAKPGVPNLEGLVGSEANAIEPGKRMLSSMTPTIVEDPSGRLLMVIGTPGGATIITTVFQVIMNVIDHGMSIEEAVAAPRFHHQWRPDVLRYERFALPRDVVENLERRGWKVEGGYGTWGRADGIMVSYTGRVNLVEDLSSERGRRVRYARYYLGGADPRGEDVVMGY